MCYHGSTGWRRSQGQNKIYAHIEHVLQWEVTENKHEQFNTEKYKSGQIQ